ncbi:MAG: fibronectin type III domain-containing protein [Ignavibacterium sp.]
MIVTIFVLTLSCSEIVTPPDTFPPDTPKNFILLGAGDGQAHFRWERNFEPDFKEYRLYRSVNNINSFHLLVSLTQTEYVDRFLDYDSVYYYYLTAVDFAGNESVRTNIIDVQPLNISAPLPPSRLLVQGTNNPAQGLLEIKLSWLPPNVSDLRNYRIYRGNDSNFIPDQLSLIDTTTVSSYLDRLVVSNQRYYYKIVAVDKGGKTSFPTSAANDIILQNAVLVSPANNSRFTDPKTFKWGSVSDAVAYEVFVGNGPLSGVIWSSGKTTQTEISYTGPNLISSKVYYWWVGSYSKNKEVFDDGTEAPAQINSYSQVNSFFVE